MSKSELILDVGIGSGGDYLKLDLPPMLRVGLDVDTEALVDLRLRYPRVNLIRADAVCFEGLPFTDNVFDKVGVILPFDTLLHGLCSNNLATWDEFYRVLKPGGKVEIITDTRALETIETIQVVAEAKGFNAELKEIGSFQVRALRTKFGYILTSDRIDEVKRPRFYQLEAVKPS